MKLCGTLAALSSLCCLSAAVTLTKIDQKTPLGASATLVNFDLPDQTPISDQYKARGVVFSKGSLIAIRDNIASIYVLPTSDNLTQAGGEVGGDLTLTFTKPVSKVTFPYGIGGEEDLTLTASGFTTGEKAASLVYKNPKLSPGPEGLFIGIASTVGFTTLKIALPKGNGGYVIDDIKLEFASGSSVGGGGGGGGGSPVPAPTPSTGGTAAKPYKQCGGKGFTLKKCTTGYECSKRNGHYSQCRPKAVPAGQVAFWKQCGGRAYKGSKVCAAGSKCEFINKGYSLCKPDLAV